MKDRPYNYVNNEHLDLAVAKTVALANYILAAKSTLKFVPAAIPPCTVLTTTFTLTAG